MAGDEGEQQAGLSAEHQQAGSSAEQQQQQASSSPEQQLLEACRAGQLERVQELLAEGAEPAFQDTEGISPLMAAAETGDAALVAALLEAGAPWHAQDAEGYTAGEYASGSGHRHIVDLLLDWAVRAELILGTISRRERKDAGGLAANRDYLGGSLRYEDGKLIDAEGEAVMMGWEAPLMERHAEIICRQGGDVLNVGFGLGIIDTAIQAHSPRSHTIIEAHPDVYAHMVSQGWDKRPGVRVVFGRWQDVIEQLGPFDGIFFDTYGEFWEDMSDFHQHLPRILRPGGIYSFFNGLAPDNLFFHLVYGKIAELELSRLGLRTTYEPVPIDASADKIWEGVKNRYWHLPVYFVPTCVMEAAAEEEGQEGKAGAAAAAAGGEGAAAAGRGAPAQAGGDGGQEQQQQHRERQGQPPAAIDTAAAGAQ